MLKWDVFLALQIFSELKKIDNNAKIRSYLYDIPLFC